MDVLQVGVNRENQDNTQGLPHLPGLHISDALSALTHGVLTLLVTTT